MLSLFPQLFDFGFAFTFLLRAITALFFIYEGILLLKKREHWFQVWEKLTHWPRLILGIFSLLGGIMLFVGFLTQAVAILLSVTAIGFSFLDISSPNKKTKYFILLAVLAISFLFSGPGLWSFDYPL